MKKIYLGCLKPFLRCRFGAQSKKYRPKGKAAKIQEAFDVPSYVLHHIMMGQIGQKATQVIIGKFQFLAYLSME